MSPLHDNPTPGFFLTISTKLNTSNLVLRHPFDMVHQLVSPHSQPRLVTSKNRRGV